MASQFATLLMTKAITSTITTRAGPEDMHSMGTLSKRFHVMVEGSDAAGRFITTYEIDVESERHIQSALVDCSQVEGWRLVCVESVELIGRQLGEVGLVRRSTGRTYFGSDDELEQS